MLIDLNKIKDKYTLNINGVIHVGAHYGEEYNLYKKLAINNIMFFEPIYESFLKLCGKIDDPYVKVFNLALGNIQGRQKMYIESTRHGQSSSLLEPNLHLKYHPNIKFDGQETVTINRLDNINYDRNKYNLLNIDTQGYELEVLKGAYNSLGFIDYIYSEVNYREIYKDCVLRDDFVRFINQMGFYVFEEMKTSYHWGDIFAIKKH